MTKMKYLYSLMHDDLKDADMEIGYAEKLMNVDKDEAKYYVDEAMKRLSSFSTRHEKFEKLVSKYTADHPNEKSDNACWSMAHEYFVDWYLKMKSKIDALNKMY